jgi:hypothetical protein
MQRNFPFLAILPAPKHAPADLVRRVDTDAQAISVSMIGMKQAYIAASLGISAAYLSQMVHGRAVPDWIVEPFCVLTGTRLLAQVRKLREAQDIAHGIDTAANVIRRMAAELRSAAA